MFGGVVFGKAAFGMRKRAQIFVSYAWDSEEHIALVGGLKEDIERATNLSAWMDRERMGGGCDLDEEMKRGVANADVVLCCLTDKYLSRENCLFELQAARFSNSGNAGAYDEQDFMGSELGQDSTETVKQLEELEQDGTEAE